MGKTDNQNSQPDSLTGNLLKATLEHAYYQGVRLSELAHQDFPFTDCKRIISFLKSVNRAIVRRLERLGLEALSSPTDKEAERDLHVSSQRFGHLLNVMDEYLRLLEFSTRSHISQGSVNLLETLTMGFKENERFILVPEYEFNYSYLDILRHLRSVVAEATIAIPEANRSPKSIAVLSYPNIFRENALANALLAHELGHFVVEQTNIVENLLNGFKFDEVLLNRVVEEAKRAELRNQSHLTEFFEEDFIKSGIMKEALEKLTSWEIELASDLCAFRMVGPVFVYALSRFLLTLHDVDATNDHPSARVRLKLLVRELQVNGFTTSTLDSNDSKKNDKVDGATRYFTQLQDFLDSPKRRPESHMNSLLGTAMTGLQKKMQKSVDQIFESQKYKRYTVKEFREDVPRVYAQLQSLVPPCELGPGQPADIVSILNAGMIFVLRSKDEIVQMLGAKNLDEQLSGEAAISGLIMKGIELSHAERLLLL